MQNEHKNPMPIACFGIMNDIEQDNPALHEKWDLLEVQSKEKYCKMAEALGGSNLELIGADEFPNKFIAIYSDGSGASILQRKCDHYFIFACDEDQTPCTVEDIQDAGFCFFIALPDNFDIFMSSKTD